MTRYRTLQDPPWAAWLFGNTRAAWFWLVVRIYVGWQWIEAGWTKVHSPAWVGPSAGNALAGFIKGALAKTAGEHPDVQGWYGSFLNHAVLPHVTLWSHAIAWGEVAVGAGLILGAFTGIAAFFGVFMNLNYLMSGTVSINPILFVCGMGLVLAWKVAGYIGVDYWLLPMLGTPWRPGKLFHT